MKSRDVIINGKSYKGLYKVLDKGIIYSLKTNRFLKGFPDGRRGYLKVKLYDENGNPTTYYVHRIVMESFSKKNEDHSFQEVDHINNILTDNNLKNLRWVERSFNMGRKKNTSKNNVKDLLDKIIEKYYKIKNMRSVSEIYNVDQQSVSDLLHGKRYFNKDGIPYILEYCTKNNIDWIVYENLNSNRNKKPWNKVDKRSETSV